jgi:large subunit ribosomal protein L10
MEGRKPHISGYKKKIVDDFVKLIKEYPIIGAVNMENLPAPQLQVMRGQLRGTVVIRMTRRRLIKIAIEQAKAEKKGIEELEKHLKGMPALLFSKENPFKLYKTLKKSKSSAPAKAGQAAPRDIVIQAGPTPFAPGPVIGELGAMGIKTAVEGGKIAIQEDTVVVKEGGEIKANVAGMLTRLGIKPMEIGLDLVAVYEDGTIYTKDVLDIDEDKFLAQLQDANRWAFNLAVEAGYFTKDTVELLVPKAFNEAKALALEANIMADAVAEELIAKAEAQGKSLKDEIKYEEKIGKVEEAPKEEKKPEEKPAEAPKEEPKPEEKKEEAPKEEVKEEPKVEEKKEEVKEEEPKPEPKEEKKEPEPVKEEPKTEEKKPEEPKIEETPKEEPKPESKEEKKEPEVPKVEEKKEVREEPEPKKEEVPKPEPQKKLEQIETKEDIKTRAQELKEKLEKARQAVKSQAKEEVKVEKKEIPKVEVKPIVEDRSQNTEIITNVPKSRVGVEKKEEEIGKVENLFRELQKKGTLRDIQQSKSVNLGEKPKEPLTPQQIIEKGIEKMKQKKEEDVPSAYELMKKKMREKRI